LLREFDDFIEQERSGYFVIEAVTRRGFLADAANARGYAYWAVSPGSRTTDGVEQTLLGIAGQLVPDMPQSLVASGVAELPGFLTAALGRAAERDKRVVIAIDDLDQACSESDRLGITGRNPLELPPDLPTGVYIIVTTRPAVLALSASCIRTKRIDADTRAAHERDEYTAAWQRWRGKPQSALLSLLAVAESGLTIQQLCAFAGSTIGDCRMLESALQVDLDAHVARTPPTGDEPDVRYQLRDHDFHDFLRGFLAPDELAVAARQAHARIADWYLRKWGGLRPRNGVPLPRLNPAPELTDTDDRYGIAFLMMHLAGAEQDDHLHNLLALSRLDDPSRGPGTSGWRRKLAQFGRRTDDTSKHTEPYNLWFALHARAGEVREYLRQVDLAWQRAQDRSQVGLQVRYALHHASVNSVAESLPPPLLRALVDRNLWRWSRAVAFATRIPDAARRALAYAELADSNQALEPFRTHLLEDALAAADAIGDAPTRTDTLIALLRRLPDALKDRASQATLQAAEAIAIEDVQSQRLSALARQLPAEWLPRVVTQAERIANEVSRGRALVGVAVQLASLGHVDRALALISKITYDTARAEALAEIASRVPESGWRQALERARSLPPGRVRTAALIQFAACAARLGHFDESLTLARAMDTDLARAEALASIGPFLPDAVRNQAISVARGLTDSLCRARALAGMVREQPAAERDQLVRDTLDENARITVPENRHGALVTIAAKLQPAHLATAASQARQLPAIEDRSQVLQLLAVRQAQLGSPAGALETIRHLTDERAASRGIEELAALQDLPRPVVAQMLELAGGFKTNSLRDSALGAVARQLESDELLQAMRFTYIIGDADTRGQARAALLPYLPTEFAEAALNSALLVEDQSARALSVQHLVPYLADRHLRRAVAIESAITNADARSSFNAACVERLAAVGQVGDAERLLNNVHGNAWREAAVALVPAMIRSGRLSTALDLLVVVQHPPAVVRVLVSVAQHLPEQALATVLAQVQHFAEEYDESKAEGLAAIAPRMPEPRRADMVGQALTAARRAGLQRQRGVSEEAVRARALAGVARHLPDLAIQGEALEAVRDIGDEAERVRALVLLLATLSEELLTQTIALIRAVRDPARAALVWTSLLRRRAEWIPEAQAAVANIPDATDRADALVNLTVALAGMPGDQTRQCLNETLLALATASRQTFLRHLITLAPVIHSLGGELAIRQVDSAIAEAGTWWP
jgi:hypothetical protein